MLSSASSDLCPPFPPCFRLWFCFFKARRVNDIRLKPVTREAGSHIIFRLRKPSGGRKDSDRGRTKIYFALGAALPDFAGVFSVALRARVLSRIAVCFFLRTFSRAFSFGIDRTPDLVSHSSYPVAGSCGGNSCMGARVRHCGLSRRVPASRGGRIYLLCATSHRVCDAVS